jgi:probable rRNA maturation factor
MTKQNLIVELHFEDLFFPQREAKCPICSETWQHWIQKWLESLQDRIPKKDIYELSLRLTDDREIKNLNRKFRSQNQPTDVLAFAALEVQGPSIESSESLYLGDVVISVETAQVQAQQQGHSLGRELAWLASHGFLHLLGWDHPDEESLREMLAQQESLLEQWHIL